MLITGRRGARRGGGGGFTRFVVENTFFGVRSSRSGIISIILGLNPRVPDPRSMEPIE